MKDLWQDEEENVTYKAKTPLEKAIGQMIRSQGGPWLSEKQMASAVVVLKKKGITEPGKDSYDDIARIVGKFLSKYRKKEGIEEAEPIEEAIKHNLSKMLPWADDPEFGGTNAI